MFRWLTRPPKKMATPGHLITKEHRQELFGKVGGGAGSVKPEQYQRAHIVQETGCPCPKTNVRINLRTGTLQRMAHPNMNVDGFDYSEDFDGVQNIGPLKTVYINLKCVVGKGGSQTRSLREVYWFVEGQLKVLKGPCTGLVYFANILDGDEAHAALPKFEYLLARPEFATVRSRVYVGDLVGYPSWCRTIL
jgi:hypothetical protein